MRAFNALLTALGLLAILGANVLDNMVDLPPAVASWGLVLFVVGVGLSTIMGQLEFIFAPKINLADKGIQPDKRVFYPAVRQFLWWKREYRQVVFFPAIYLAITNKARLGILRRVEGILARITWFDEGGNPVAVNRGRWWRTNVPQYRDTFVLQTVDLEPNKQEQILHFARHVNGKLSPWHRTADNKEPIEYMDDGEYHVKIELNSNTGSRARFDFLVSCVNQELWLTRIRRWHLLQRWIRRNFRWRKKTKTKKQSKVQTN